MALQEKWIRRDQRFYQLTADKTIAGSQLPRIEEGP